MRWGSVPREAGSVGAAQKGNRLVEAVFLDRDGVINENRKDHVKSWTEFCFVPGAPQAVARLSQAGIRVFVITNQAIVNRGIVSRETVDLINERMVRGIEEAGGRVEAVAYCPHRPDEECDCRKPKPGLIHELARACNLELNGAVLVGDALTDVEAAHAAGLPAILVLTGRGREQLALAGGKNGLRIAQDLMSAVDLLLPR